MIPVYEDYLKEPLSLSFDGMAALHREIAQEAAGDSGALELYGELLSAAVKYAEIRARWNQWSREEKAENDSLRTSRHNRVIDSLNILARYLKKQGTEAAWRNVLGDETENPYYRKRIGDFACYLAFVEGLHAR